MELTGTSPVSHEDSPHQPQPIRLRSCSRARCRPKTARAMLRAPIRDPTTREHQKGAGMAGPSLEHRIRADLVRALHRKHLDGSGTVDIEHIARENGVSQ